MLAVTALSFLVIIHQSFGSIDLDKLQKAHPTWSFKLESIDSLLKDVSGQLPEFDSHLTMATRRPKFEASFGPKATDIVRKVGDLNWPTSLPQTFDAREKWKGCAKLMEQPTDEGACTNDGMVIVASVLSDKYCITSNETFREKLSAEALTGCADFCKEQPDERSSYGYAYSNGIPTGGAYNSNQGCIPYTQAPCKHTNDTYVKGESARDDKVCDREDAFEPVCPVNCSNPAYPISKEEDTKYLKSWYYLSGGHEKPLMQDILTYGPVITSIYLHDDFFKHPKGVYKVGRNAKYLGRIKHIKLIGWGREKQTNYWLAVNTWDNWGDSKVFKISRPTLKKYSNKVASTGKFKQRRLID